MVTLTDIGKWLIGLGVSLVIIGGLIIGISRLTLGRSLPGDIFIQRGNATFYFPIVTCLVVSVILSLLLTIFAGRR